MSVTNVKMDVKDSVLTIKINLKSEGSPSKSGKSILVASTGGFTEVPGAEGFSLGLNLTKKKGGE